jgi:hypothetical protein
MKPTFHIYLKKTFLYFFIGVLVAIAQISDAATTWDTKTVNTPARTGCQTGSYDITLQKTASCCGWYGMANNATVTITFNASAGIDCTTCTGGTHNGTAVAAGAMTLTATTITYNAPVAVAEGTSFHIILNGITHGSSIAAGNITVSIPCTTFGPLSGTTNNYTTAAATAPTTSAAGSDQAACLTTATLAGNTPVTGTGTWTLISGSGTITTPSSPTSGLTGLGSGANTFRWTIATCAASSTDDVIITNSIPTTSAAGGDQAVCTTTATLAGNTPTVGTGTWTLVSGSGTITTSGSATSGLTALGAGANTFRWTIANGGCTSSTDDVIITNNTPTTSAAGSDQVVCATTATMNANNPAIGTGAWSLVSGTGTITTSTLRTSGLTALAVGANTFRWTITQGACTSTDDVIITNDVAAGGTASATSNCGTTSSLSLAGENGTIQWQQQVNGAGGYSNIAGATTDPYTATLVFANSYDFRAVLTSSCGTSTSTVASIAAGGGATNYTFASPTLALSVYNGYCVANYTFTQSTTAARGSSINTGVTATINFMAGTNATTMTSGTFNGVAINMGTVVKTATSVTFTTPASVCNSTSFTIVLNGITNPPWATSGNATVSIPNVSGGTDSYSTYSATIATTLLAFYDEAIGGSSPTYATSNGLGHCVNNLTAGVTYCYDFVYPASGDIKGSFRVDLGTAPGACGSSSQYMSVSPANGGGCASTANTNMNQFASECTSMISGGMGVGATCGGGMTAGTVYTVCYTVPAGCSGLNICPLINCTAGSCGGGGTSLPVELLYFNAVMDHGVVKLNWATAVEINNDFFTIERTPDGKVYSIAGYVGGSGNSNSYLSYNSVDETPLKGISYYRLRQTDFDGKFSYSKVVSVETASENPLTLLYISPDQNKNSLQYQFSYTGEKPLLVEVIDVLGKTVYSSQISADNNSQVLNTDLSGLSKGVYVFKVSDGMNTVIKKFFY